MKLRRLVSVLSLVLLTGGWARADYSFEFTDSSGNSTGNQFTVAVGATVSINVYVAETSGSKPSGTNLATYGLNSGGVQLNTSVPSAATVTSVTPNAAFEQNSSTTGANASVIVNQVFNPAVAADSNDRVLLGTFTFTGQSAGSTVTVTAVPATGTAVNVLGNGMDIDSYLSEAGSASASITVTAVPEPSSLILGGLLAVGLVGGSVRRLRRQLATA